MVLVPVMAKVMHVTQTVGTVVYKADSASGILDQEITLRLNLDQAFLYILNGFPSLKTGNSER